MKNYCILKAIENDAPMEHSLIIIDDFANDLKDKELCQKINKAIVILECR